MFEKLRQFLDDSKSMLEDAFVVPDDKDFVAVPPDVTEEQLIEEAKQYVDAIIVPRHNGHHQNLVGVASEPEVSESGDCSTDIESAANAEK